MDRHVSIFIKTAAILSFFLPAVASAAGYISLEPLPFFTAASGASLPALLQALFKLLIIGGAALAVLMTTIGGIQYMTGDSLGQKGEGRSRIQNSLFGLILLLLIYLILRTINPQLLNFDLSSIDPVGGKSAQMAAQSQARATQQQTAAAAGTPGPASPGYSAGASIGTSGGGTTYNPGSSGVDESGYVSAYGGYSSSSGVDEAGFIATNDFVSGASLPGGGRDLGGPQVDASTVSAPGQRVVTYTDNGQTFTIFALGECSALEAQIRANGYTPVSCRQ